jgi:hypothetical protein
MTATIAPSPAAIRALLYVDGESRRVKASPTKLTPLAGKIMAASGALTTRRKAASYPRGRIIGGMALLAMTAAFFLAGGPASVQTQTAAVLRVEASALAAGVVGPQQAMAAERRPEARAEPADLASAAGRIADQDRFEIERFIRLGAAVRPEKAAPRTAVR